MGRGRQGAPGLVLVNDMASDIEITVDREGVLVRAPDLLNNRQARMFFRTILGAAQTDDGWSCPRRSRSTSDLVLQISTFLERHGWKAKRDDYANELVKRELENKRSFTRSREQAVAFREGTQTINVDDVRRLLHEYGWNDTDRNLKDHQLAGLAHALTAVNAANFSVPGSGKTATALAVAATHLASDTIDAIVVVGPLLCRDRGRRSHTSQLRHRSNRPI